MEEEASPYYPTPEGPAPGQPPVPPRRVPRVAIAVGLTALFGLGGAGLAFATSGGGGVTGQALSASSPTTLPGDQTPVPKGPLGKFPGRAFRFGGGLAGPGVFGGPIVHAEYTVQDGSGYKTYATQVGQVVAVSSTSITVKSDDGYTQTYVVEPSTIVDSQAAGISAVAGKDTVRVEALVAGSTQTATDIVDTTKIGASRKGFGFPEPPQGWQGKSPADAPTVDPSTQGGPGVPA